MEKRELRKGDKVVMHTCMEHDNPKYFGKIWTCGSDEFINDGRNGGSVFLEGYRGSFATKFLQLVQIPEKRPVFPAQPNSERWKISFNYLCGISDAVGDFEDTITLEAIEAVLLAIGDVEEGDKP
jgi:hypothetical protein